MSLRTGTVRKADSNRVTLFLFLVFLISLSIFLEGAVGSRFINVSSEMGMELVAHFTDLSHVFS